MTKRNFHHKKPKKPTANENAVANGTVTLLTAAAARVLETKYEWESAAAVRFGEEMVTMAMELAEMVNELGRAKQAGRRPAATEAT